MNITKTILCTLPFVVASCCTMKKNNVGDTQKVFADADSQYRVMATLLPDGRFPQTFEKDKFVSSGSDWWCSGFYAGALYYIWQQTKDPAIYDDMQKSLGYLKHEQFNKSTHDIGFMMYCSFGNLEKAQPSKETEDILMNSARSLVTRFDPKVGCIRSWNSKPGHFLVIIDNMMNLELLFWATRHSGDSSFYKVAVTHANTTMKNHFRDDYSSFHVVDYNSEDGSVLQRRTAQGYSDTSAWARGQGWGLYGYTVMYRETKNPVYLAQANHIADFILNNPHLPADKVPYWDFNAPDIPNALRDASAGAVIASALLELRQYVDKGLAKKYTSVAQTILKNLQTGQYTADKGTNGGFILKHSVGSIPGKTEVDVPLTYADYYYLEALTRLKSGE
ncbi:MAG: glycoside hydrolase family 88 protein [Chitinophagaceae bacterium]